MTSVPLRSVRTALLALLAACALALSLAPGASAAGLQSVGVPVPVVGVPSLTFVPPGFTTDGAQAIAAAEANPTMQQLHAHEHPLHLAIGVWRINHEDWRIEFSYNGTIVAEVAISPHGRVTNVWTGPVARASYARGNYAPLFDSPWVSVVFSILFLIPFLDPRRIRRWLHLDALVLLSFVVSYSLFDHGHLETAVWLVYPPLLYLLARMLWIGMRGTARPRLGSWLSIRLLAAGLTALVVARITLSLVDQGVIDVGFASVIGAFRAAHGQALYYVTAGHGDTYGPIAYIAYLPFELIFPWNGTWNYLPAAHAAGLFFDLATIAGLVQLGRVIRPGRQGLRLGLVFGWAWAANPFTLLCLMEHSNDGLIAMLSVLTLLALNSAPARGALLGLAAAAKFSPAGLLPLVAVGRERSGVGVFRSTVAFVGVVVISIGLYLPSGGISEFWNHTIGFQLSRTDVFSPWALHPGLAPLKDVLELLAVVVAAGVAFGPRKRSLVQVTALAAAVTIAVQLPAVHWFYYYIVWFMPFAIVALLGDGGADRTGIVLDAVVADEPVADPAALSSDRPAEPMTVA